MWSFVHPYWWWLCLRTFLLWILSLVESQGQIWSQSQFPKWLSVLLAWREQWKYNELILFAGVKLKLPCLLYPSYLHGIYKTTDWDMASFRCSCLPCWLMFYLWQLVFHCHVKWLGVDTSESSGASWICGQKAGSLYGLSVLSTFFKEGWLGQIAIGVMAHGCAKAEESSSLLFSPWMNQEWEGSYRASHNHISWTPGSRSLGARYWCKFWELPTAETLET